MRPQHLAQSRMQQVRGGVVAHGGFAPTAVHLSGHHSPFRDRPQRVNPVHHRARSRLVRGLHRGQLLARFAIQQEARVAHLTACLGVERSAV